jgi:hypothetical protein
LMIYRLKSKIYCVLMPSISYLRMCEEELL